MAVKEETFVMHSTGERYDVTVKGTQENGSAISFRFSESLQGGPLTFSAGAPPARTSVVMKRIDDSTRDVIVTRDGQVVSTERCTVSTDGKTMQWDQKSIDEQGTPVQGLMLWDKQ
jgi:hypothetical protein